MVDESRSNHGLCLTGTLFFTTSALLLFIEIKALASYRAITEVVIKCGAYLVFKHLKCLAAKKLVKGGRGKSFQPSLG